MNWLTNFRTPGLKGLLSATKKDTPDNLWVKCPLSGELIYKSDLEESFYVTPAGAHLRISPRRRFRLMFDKERWEPIPLPPVVQDPLRFKDDKPYPARLKAAKVKLSKRDREEAPDSGSVPPVSQDDCMSAAFGKIGDKRAVVLVQDFAFMGGSLGMAAGEAFIAAAQMAVARKAAFIVCTSSGGARMQEGTLSLMQMPRTTLAIQEVKEAGLPYLVILCDPTSGGVSASYAMLGDVHLAEPGAMIAFSGPRVIEQTIREKLPDGFQRSEFLRDKGQVDIVVSRSEVRSVLSTLLKHLMSSDQGQGKYGSETPVTPPSADVPSRKTGGHRG